MLHLSAEIDNIALKKAFLCSSTPAWDGDLFVGDYHLTQVCVHKARWEILGDGQGRTVN